MKLTLTLATISALVATSYVASLPLDSDSRGDLFKRCSESIGTNGPQAGGSLVRRNPVKCHPQVSSNIEEPVPSTTVDVISSSTNFADSSSLTSTTASATLSYTPEVPTFSAPEDNVGATTTTTPVESSVNPTPSSSVVAVPESTPTAPSGMKVGPLPTNTPTGEQTIHGSFTGTATFYDASSGQHSCSNMGSGTEFTIAMNQPQMGSQSWGNPNCFRKVAVTYNGVTVQAMITNTCPECPHGNIDVSRQIADYFGSKFITDGINKVSWSMLE
ncbi:hypothetical protein IWQ60_000232 [Tieghemiomyces parasiticus]|uniref:RlpA-like protein double-psi beta-barrel domain-containing protein n=1 Tax=Tieghemiomyces parasiticus TaxID=78921 RepID=A0A9W8E2Z4_9FUNG|nr:hypothetical protein IWQ60_000232 [Tieghemiomyces parasiticus]